jgi:Fur family iron response transcriptional regulator
LIEDSGELQDIHGATVALGNLPAPPDGLRVDRIDVVVRLRRGPA